MTRRAVAPALCLATHRHDPERPRQAAPGLNLCPGCHVGLARHLADLPGLHDDVLDQLPANGTVAGPAVSGSPGQPLPYNPAAGDLLSQLRHDLTWLTRLVAEQRGLTTPPPRPPDQCAWLSRHTDWIAAHPDAGAIKGTLTELVGRAWAVIDPARRPLLIGPCLETIDDQPCDGTLRATVRRDGDPTPSEIYCDTCPLSLDTTQWHRFGKRYLAERARIAG
ncbi:hypothetical protein [Nonomuraea typhae]|uniref:hypothetical protein n=1 Tax=Nonomuraea typhae TaxID=2603600 RepID=UPI0012FC8421|nr:hypothetical protein [Nonomuraea typhae]